jgi:hypothetical protein
VGLVSANINPEFLNIGNFQELNTKKNETFLDAN